MHRIALETARWAGRSLLAGWAAASLAACVTLPGAAGPAPDYSAQSYAQTQGQVATLNAQYKANPRDKNTAIGFASALRAAGQPSQAVAVIENSLSLYQNDPDLRLAYAKALTADGRFPQALSVINDHIAPDRPDWNALSVKGAILDQMGRHEDARRVYAQALLLAPTEASLEANMGLSFAMTGELPQAERHLRRASQLPGAKSQVRQNLALVIGLQGRLDEARAIYAAELSPQQVDANMAYVQSVVAQQG